ncbi:unnamed protein product [Fusarium langsethiae]|nr:unnamed protein product [Fusarium langsethiae]
MSSSNTRTLCCDFQQNSDYAGGACCGRVPVVECDVLVIGAGAAGLTAAASIRDQKLRVFLLEKDEYVGGTTFRSGGCMWMPYNPRMQEQGIEDSRELAERYIRAVRNAKDEGRDPDPVQEHLWNRWLEVYLTQGPQMMDYLQGEGFRWMAAPSAIPNYHDQHGAVKFGRTLDPEVFDAVSLGDWLRYLPPQDDTPVIRRFEDIFTLTRPPYSVDGAASVAPPHTAVKPLSMGRSLVAQLLKICKDHNNVNIWTKCELRELQYCEMGHRVTGARIQCGRRESLIDIRASLGVVLTTGGFSQNQEMRDTYVKVGLTKGTNPQVSSKTEWSLAAPSDMGIALQVGQKLGADTAQLDQVWGIPTMIDPATGKSREAMFAITKPFSIVTDTQGFRFFSESQPYGVAVRSMYKRAREVPEGGAFWLIFDNTYMQRYSIGGLAGQASVNQAVSNGFLFCSETIRGLSDQILDHDHNLEATVDECWKYQGFPSHHDQS